MPSLYVRNVPAELYEALRRRAEREERSISGQTIAILRRSLLNRRDATDLLENLHRIREQSSWPATGPRPEDLIRDARDAR